MDETLSLPATKPRGAPQLDTSRLIGLGLICVGAGLIIGYKLAGGITELPTAPAWPTVDRSTIPPPPHRCVECDEKAERDAARVAAASAEARAVEPQWAEPPAPPEPRFDHTVPAPSATSFSPLASPSAAADTEE